MRFFRDLSIRRKLAFNGIVTTAVALLLACGAFVAYEQITFRKTMTRDLSITAQMIAFNSAAALSFDDANSAEQTLKALAAQPHITAACVYDAHGYVFAVYRRNAVAALQWPEPKGDREEFGGESLRIFRQINLAGETIGTIYLESDLAEISARWRRYLIIAGLVMSGAIFAAILLGSRLQRMISEPISQLMNAMAGVAAGENRHSIRVEKRGHDELGRLVDGFNDMLSQIEGREADLRKAHAELETRVEERTRELRVQITERQRTEEERDRFFTLSLDLLCIAGFDGHLWRTNPAFETLLGFSGDELQRMDYVNLVHPDDRAATRSELQKLSAGGTVLNFEIRIRCSNGSYRWFAWSCKASPEGTCFYGYGRDVTDRKRTEVELRAKTALLEAQLDSAIDGILVVDGDGRKLYQNRRMVELWKIPREFAEDINDERQLQWVTEQVKDSEQFVAMVRELYANRDGSSRDEVATKNGMVFDRYSAPVVDKDGKYYGRIWGFRDITERKRAEVERETLHRQLLDISRQAGMAEVATSVLHNVGNVLNSVNVSATLVLDEVRDSKIAIVARVSALLREHEKDLGAFFTHDPRGRQVPQFLQTLAERLANEQGTVLREVELLQKNIEHIKEIVAMQQNYARISGVVETVAVAELVEHAVQMNAGALERHGVALVRDYRDSPNITVEKHKVLQILVNLIRNAKYACEECGRADKLITLQISADADRVCIRVRDNGVGIPAENLSRIFNHGFTTRASGHGFGLHSGALVAQELGGAIRVCSDGAGQGAEFAVELPYRPKEKAA